MCVVSLTRATLEKIEENIQKKLKTTGFQGSFG